MSDIAAYLALSGAVFAGALVSGLSGFAFSAVAGGIAALYGPLHGGANEQVLRMINEIGTVKNVPAFVESVKGGKGSRLMGVFFPRLACGLCQL